jgi:cell cycle serine/threonine-protein kinase CDC5/MSD2
MPRERASMATLIRNVPLENIQEEEDNDHRRRELESQKARIVAQMVPVTTSVTTDNLDALATSGSKSTLAKGSTLPVGRPLSTVADENVPPTPATMASATVESKPKKNAISIPIVPSASKNAKAYDVFANTLTVAFRAQREGKIFRDPSE